MPVVMRVRVSILSASKARGKIPVTSTWVVAEWAIVQELTMYLTLRLEAEENEDEQT